MPDLKSVIDSSLAAASKHSKKVYGKNPLTYEEILDLANGRALALAATVKPTGTPHLSPTDIVAVDGKLFVGVDEVTARHRNLKRNPSIVVMIVDGRSRQAILEGSVKFLDLNGELAQRVLSAQKEKYGWVTDEVAELSVDKAFTWKQK